ncbi:hypothetical protein QBC36DRAFT_294271 [Triangularia setosa]|uniref:Uncharacterized protein n=1 Tax=Triangularia setosa TaxID=2587417 RepID=A0AAN7A448_9PEZI|nr:hypothetical protein QBC36DRAFT_294271 [Podospora setosa]
MSIFLIKPAHPPSRGLWSNILTQASIYSSLCSRILGSRSRRTDDTNGSDMIYTGRTYPPPTFQQESQSKTSFRTGS